MLLYLELTQAILCVYFKLSILNQFQSPSHKFSQIHCTRVIAIFYILHLSSTLRNDPNKQ